MLVSRKSFINIVSIRYYSSIDGLKTSTNEKKQLNSKCSTEPGNSPNSSNQSAPVHGSSKEGDDDDDDMEEMFVVGPGPNNDIEWG